MAQDMPINNGQSPKGAGSQDVADDATANKAAFDSFSERLDQARGEQPTTQNDHPSQGQAMGMGLKLASELLAALIVGGVLGFGADMIFNTKPLFILSGLALGCAAAFMNVLRMMKKLSNEQKGASPDAPSQSESQ